jgi:hypothetical protein
MEWKAKIIQQVFALYLDGRSLSAIAKQLRAEGVPRRARRRGTDARAGRAARFEPSFTTTSTSASGGT